MKTVCLIFQVHQPVKLRSYRFFDIGSTHDYYDDQANEVHFQRIARQCYLPVNAMLLKHIQRLDGRLKTAFCISGVTLDQLTRYAPEAVDSFRTLADTGCVEFLSGTWSCSLSSLINQEAFKDQVSRHRQSMTELSSHRSGVFFNSGLIYSDQIGANLCEMGFRGALTEGAGQILGWKNPGALYANPISPGFRLLFRHRNLSNDLAATLSGLDQTESPLSPDKYLNQILSVGPEDKLVNIALAYETLGSFHPEKNKISGFLDHFLFLATKNPEICFSLPSEIIDQYKPVSLIHVPNPVSWNGEESNLDGWTGNDLQLEALSKLYELVPRIKILSDQDLIRDWNLLQPADHFESMSAVPQTGPTLSASLKSQDPPFQAFINFMNILNDFKIRLNTIL